MSGPHTSTTRVIRPLPEAIAAVLLTLIVALSGVGFLWQRAVDAQYEAIGKELLHLAKAAATVVDGDLHHTLRRADQTGSPEHLRFLEPLVRFHKANEDLIYVYTAILQGKDIFFVAGTETLYMAPYDDKRDQPPEPLMQPFKGEDLVFRAALEQQTATGNNRPFRWGDRVYLSAFAPFYRSSGEFEGVVAVDMWGGRLEKRITSIHRSAAMAVLMVMAVALGGGLSIHRLRQRAAADQLALIEATEEAIAARGRAEENAARNAALNDELRAHRESLQRLVEERTRDWETSEARFRSLVEQSLVGIFITSGDRIVYANPGMARMLGHEDPAEVLRIDWRTAVRIISITDVPVPEQRARAGTLAAAVSVVELDKRDGSPVRLEIYTQSLATDAEPEHLAVVLDVTARERAEEARTAALATAEHFSQLKSEFISTMSHELRTPLHGIIGLAHAGSTASDPQRMAGFFRKIIEAGDSLRGMIEQVLDFAALEGGELPVRPGEESLITILDGVVADYRPKALQKGLEFLDRRDPQLPAFARLDGERVVQVLGILLSNAIKFTSTGSVGIEAATDAAGLRIVVRDTGVGIDPAYVERLFVPFEQQDGSRTRSFGGIGLGLSLARLLVERMGGTIAVESRQGEGSTFTLRLPLSAAA